MRKADAERHEIVTVKIVKGLHNFTICMPERKRDWDRENRESNRNF